MNTKYLCTCLKRYDTNLSLKVKAILFAAFTRFSKKFKIALGFFVRGGKTDKK